MVRGLDPDVATEPALLDDAVSLSVFPQRVAALFIGVLGLIGLGLAAMGVYAILAFQVAQRTRELGIRIALGAGAREIAGLVLRRGVLLTAVGCGVGLVAAAALTRALRSFLYGVGPLDPVTFVTVPVVLGAVALVASYLPAGRATRVDPMSALRTE